MSVTFSVDEVQLGERELSKSSTEDVLAELLSTKNFEQHSQHDNLMTTDGHAVLNAFQIAYDYHYPIAVTPDNIWLTIAQGVSRHILENAEELRSKFVTHSDKRILVVQRNDFVLHRQNNWEGVFDSFSAQLKEIVGADRHGIVSQGFSTTTPTDQAAIAVTLMESMSHYFGYEVHTMCGIPSITLEGTPDDWRKILKATDAFSDIDLGFWINPLQDVLKQFVAASENNIDTNFWQNFVKVSGGSGGDVTSGHINKLFPYVHTYDRESRKKIWKINEYLHTSTDGWRDGIQNDEISNGLSEVPFIWNYYGEEIPMKFAAGFIGMTQDESLVLRPCTGWAVIHTEKA